MGVFGAKSKLKIETNAPCLMVGGTLPRHKIHEIPLKITQTTLAGFFHRFLRIGADLMLKFKLDLKFKFKWKLRVKFK
jgi:hypothetical protein